MKLYGLKIGQHIKIRAFSGKSEKVLWTCIDIINDQNVYLRGLQKENALITFPNGKVSVELAAIVEGEKYLWDNIRLNTAKVNGRRCYMVSGDMESSKRKLKENKNLIFYCTDCKIDYGNDESDHSSIGITKFIGKTKMQYESDDSGKVGDSCTVTIIIGSAKDIVVKGKITKKADVGDGTPSLKQYEFVLMKPCQAYFDFFSAL